MDEVASVMKACVSRHHGSKAASKGADGPLNTGCCVGRYCRLMGIDKQAYSCNMFTKHKCCNAAFIPGVYVCLTVLVAIIGRHIWVSGSVPVGLMPDISVVSHLHRSGAWVFTAGLPAILIRCLSVVWHPV